MNRSQIPKIALLLTRGFADWEPAFIGGTGGPFFGLDVQYFTPDPGEIHSQGGLAVNALKELDALTRWQPTAIVVIGGTIWETDQAPDIGELLRVQYDRGVVIAGICGGTLALARAGLLDEVRHTSNDPDFLCLHSDAYSGSRHYVDSASAVSENRVVTAPGTAPISFTAAVFQSVGLDEEKVQQFKSMLAAEHA